MNELVAIEVDGEISTGKVVLGLAAIGEMVTIDMHDENGNTMQKKGRVVEVLE